MKIMVCGLNYAEMTGIGKYTSEMCEWLAGRGHEVHVVTAYPHYPAWRVPDGFRNGAYSRETRTGILVHRCPIYVPAVPRGWSRLASHLSFAASCSPAAMREARRLRPDVVVSVVPSLLSAIPALAAARMAGAPTWLHVQDFEVDAAFDLGVVRGSRLRRLAHRVETALMRRFDMVSTISSRMAEALTRKGVNSLRVRELRNWVDTEAIRPHDRMTAYRQELGLSPDRIVALFSGSMVAKQGLEHLIPAVTRLSTERPDLAFVLCGNGVMRSELERHLAGLPNTRFLDLQPLERLPDLLATADIHLLPQRPEILDLVMPSKLAPMLASGRPVVAMAMAGTQVAIEVDGHGVVVLPGDCEAFADAIRDLADDPARRLALGAAGRAHAVKHWSREPILGDLERGLADLMKPAR